MLDKEYAAGLLTGIVGDGNLKIDEPMKNHTSLKVGGPADILVTPGSIEKLIGVYRVCIKNSIPVFTMGNGTNLIVRDKGIRGVVIKISENLGRYEIRNETIEAEAGIAISKVSKLAMEYGLSGLEFAEGIPGTLGGAVAMNAGAYGGEMKDIVERTHYICRNGDLAVISGEGHQFGKRTSIVQKDGGIVVKSELKLTRGQKSRIRSLMEDLSRQRREKQPIEMPSAGSVFKRPEGYFAGKLIQDCGLKGYRAGGAEVSAKHCGFIINTGSATSGDIITLIEHIQKTVKSRFGVELQTEVRIVGEE